MNNREELQKILDILESEEENPDREDVLGSIKKARVSPEVENKLVGFVIAALKDTSQDLNDVIGKAIGILNREIEKEGASKD